MVASAKRSFANTSRISPSDKIRIRNFSKLSLSLGVPCCKQSEETGVRTLLIAGSALEAWRWTAMVSAATENVIVARIDKSTMCR